MASDQGNLGTLKSSDDLLICDACATQYDEDEKSGLDVCKACEDPRNVIPPTGHSFTTLRKLRDDPKRFQLKFEQEADPNVWVITIEPEFGIGQRAYLIQTAHGNILWDMVSFIDDAAVEKSKDAPVINELGGIKFMIISHPHFYTTWPDWASTFNCPIYLTEADRDWLNRKPPPDIDVRFLKNQLTTLLPGVTAIIAGGHFPGSMLLHVTSPALNTPSLFHADTIFAVPTANNPNPTKPGIPSFSFMWSVPNMIPMNPEMVLGIWRAMKGFKFEVCYGLIGTVRHKEGFKMGLEERVLESAKIFVRALGLADHEILREEV